MIKFKVTTKEESIAYALGMLAAYNSTRLRFWGFGYDNDKTGREVRNFTCEEIDKIKEILSIESFSDLSFSTVKEFADQLNKGDSNE